MSTTEPEALRAVALMRDLRQELARIREMPDVCDKYSEEWIDDILPIMDNLREHLRGMF